MLFGFQPTAISRTSRLAENTTRRPWQKPHRTQIWLGVTVTMARGPLMLTWTIKEPLRSGIAVGLFIHWLPKWGPGTFLTMTKDAEQMQHG